MSYPRRVGGRHGRFAPFTFGMVTCSMLACYVSAVIGQTSGDAATKPAAELQGNWRPVNIERDGKKLDDASLRGQRLVIKGDEFATDPQHVLQFKLDPSKTPAEIDFTGFVGPAKGKAAGGIYSIEKGRLTICFPESPDRPAARPKEFKTRPSDGLLLVQFGRLPAVPPPPAPAKGASDRAKLEFAVASELARQGRYDEAIAGFRTALSIRPNYFEALNSLGLSLAAQSRPDDAAAQFRQAVRIKPAFADAHYNLGNLQANRGRLDEAIASYRQRGEIRSAIRRGAQWLGYRACVERPVARGDRTFSQCRTASSGFDRGGRKLAKSASGTVRAAMMLFRLGKILLEPLAQRPECLLDSGPLRCA